MRILLAEDDALLGDALRSGLRQLGYQVDWVRDGVLAESELCSGVYEAAVLDLGLPRRDGMTVLRNVRQGGVRVPVLVLTAREAVPDRIEGLDAGADDYVIKPVDLHELGARLRALQRRTQGLAESLLTCGRLVLDPANRTVHVDQQAVDLSAREFDVLCALMRHPGQVLSREQLEQKLYSWGQEVESNAIEVHIHHVRRKCGADLIRTVRGVGYAIVQPPPPKPADAC